MFIAIYIYSCHVSTFTSRRPLFRRGNTRKHLLAIKAMWSLILVIAVTHQYITKNSVCGCVLPDNDKDGDHSPPNYDTFIKRSQGYADIFLDGYPEADTYGRFPPPPESAIEWRKYTYTMVTEVLIWVYLQRLERVNTEDQTATVVVEENYMWNDSRLNKSAQLNTTQLDCLYLLDANQIWTPEIIPINTLDSQVLVDHGKVQVRPTGQYSIQGKLMKYTIPCSVDVQKFPFDIHNCTLELGQNNNQQFTIRLHSYIQESTRQTFQDEIIWRLSVHESIEWHLIDWSLDVHAHRSSIKVENNPVDSLVIHLTFRRHALFYSCIFIIPIIFLNCLSLVIFKLPIDGKAKDDNARTMILNYFVLLTAIVNKSPTTGNSIPLLGIYILVSIFILALGLVFNLYLVEIKINYIQKNKRIPRFLVPIVESRCCMQLFGRHYRRVFKLSHHLIYEEDDESLANDTAEPAAAESSGKKHGIPVPFDVIYRKLPPDVRNALQWKTFRKLMTYVFFVIICLAHLVTALCLLIHMY